MANDSLQQKREIPDAEYGEWNPILYREPFQSSMFFFLTIKNITQNTSRKTLPR